MNHHLTPIAPRRQRGFTLVESLISLAIASVALGAALPGFHQARQQRHLEGLAAQLETDIHFTRSLAVARNENLRLSFQSDGAGSCYVVHSGPANACTCAADGQAVCSTGQEAMRSVRLAAADPVQLHANVRSMVFDAEKGTTSPTASMRLVAADSRELRVIVNIMGRVRACSPSALPGYAAC